jgi:AraC family transcriptional regulator
VPTRPERSFSPASLQCERALPSTKLASSADAGWTSLLIEQHRIDGATEAFETDRTPDQSIVVLTRGQMDLEAFHAGRWHKAVYQVGSVGMTPGGETGRLRWKNRGAAAFSETAHLYVPQLFFDEAAEHYRARGHAHREVALCSLVFHDLTIAQVVSALLRAMADGVPDLYAQTVAQWLAVHLLSAHGAWLDPFDDRRRPGAIADHRLARVLEYMSAHFAEPLRLDRLGREAGVSKFHFARLFRERTGVTPHGYLVQLRMDAACRLLATTDLTVAEVAAACGYATAAHFGSAFRTRFGETPKRFRARRRH